MSNKPLIYLLNPQWTSVNKHIAVSKCITADKQITLCNFINGITNLPCFRINQIQHICEMCTKLYGQNTFAFISFIYFVAASRRCTTASGNLGNLCATLVTHTTCWTCAAAKTNRLLLQPLLLWRKQWQGRNLLNTLLHLPPPSNSRT